MNVEGRSMAQTAAQCPELIKLLSQSNGAVCEKVDCSHNIFFVKLGFERVDTDRSRQIRNCACFLTEGDGFTLEEIAAMYGVTRERIRQIEEKALQKIRAFVLKHPEGQRILDGFISRKEHEEGIRLYKEQKERDAKKREGMNKPKNGHVRKKRKSRAGRACRDGYGEHLHGCSLLPDSHRGGRRWAKRNLAARNTSR